MQYEYDSLRKKVELVHFFTFFFITPRLGHIPSCSFRPLWNETTSKHGLTHHTWCRVIIGYFRRLRKPFVVGTKIPRRSHQCSAHLFQLPISRRRQEDNQCQVGREDGEVCEVRRPVLQETISPPLLL